MSIIFGVHTYANEPISERELVDLARPTERYALRRLSLRIENDLGMGFQGYLTHQRSNLESQPFLDSRGNMLAFDGRLDNYEELTKQLDIRTAEETPDSRVVLSAFERWGEECFSRLVGDWALALWSHADHSLYLARDHAGTRTLYFEPMGHRLLWSTFLETFFIDGKTRELDRQYAACYLAGRPLRHRTPYRSIRAVPPAHYVRIRRDGIVNRAHWQWMISDRIRYRSEKAYEDQFLDLFGQSVARRTGPGAPILAELSGGMDSSSIVCMSDWLRRQNRDERPVELLNTLSFYNDLEPTWDEKPYFSAVERRRGRIGTHIDISHAGPTFEPASSPWGAPLLPGANSGATKLQTEMEMRFGTTCRVILSGIGGDELLGGVPSPMPELADLLVAGDIRRLLKRSVAWCLVDRSTLLSMLSKVARFSVRLYWKGSVRREALPEWMTIEEEDASTDPLFQGNAQNARIGLSPSTIDNGLTWWTLLESLPHLFPSCTTRREYRYPYLDRDLVTFLFRVPRHILLKPGRRRALMRSALKDIVPPEILERRRKAYVARMPLSSLQREHEKIRALFEQSRLEEYGLVASSKLLPALRSIANGQDTQLWPSVMRSISFELWLRSQPSALSS